MQRSWPIFANGKDERKPFSSVSGFSRTRHRHLTAMASNRQPRFFVRICFDKFAVRPIAQDRGSVFVFDVNTCGRRLSGLAPGAASMTASSSAQNGAVCTAMTLPLNSGIREGAAIASRKATVPGFAFKPSTPSTPMTNGIFGALKILAYIANEIGQPFAVLL